MNRYRLIIIISAIINIMAMGCATTVDLNDHSAVTDILKKKFKNKKTLIEYKSIFYDNNIRVGVFQFYQLSTHERKDNFFIFYKGKILFVRNSKITGRITSIFIKHNISDQILKACLDQIQRIIDENNKIPPSSF